MPYDPTMPTVVLCRQLAAAVQSAWGPTTPSAADWDFYRRYADADAVGSERLEGRQVVFFPDAYDKASENRGEDVYTHKVQCLVVERYADAAGDPPKLWTAERVDFVHDRIVQGLWFTRDRAPWNRNLTSVSASVQVCDVSKLMSGGKLFFCLLELVYDEIIPQ